MPDTPVRIAAAQPDVTKRSLWLWAFSIFWALAVVASLSVLWPASSPQYLARAADRPTLVLLANPRLARPKIEQLLIKGVVAK